MTKNNTGVFTGTHKVSADAMTYSDLLEKLDLAMMLASSDHKVTVPSSGFVRTVAHHFYMLTVGQR